MEKRSIATFGGEMARLKGTSKSYWQITPDAPRMPTIRRGRENATLGGG